MTISLESVTAERLAEYAAIPMVCDVRSVIDIEKLRPGEIGTALVELPIERPYVKNYDAIADNSPLRWAARFDLKNWSIRIAYEDGEAVGATAMLWNSPEISLLELHSDIALLWDIRVRPGLKRRGIGKALFRFAADWAKEKGCKSLRIETQNVNVAACRFYARMGCVIERIVRGAYRGQPAIAEEVMILWRLELS